MEGRNLLEIWNSVPQWLLCSHDSELLRQVWVLPFPEQMTRSFPTTVLYYKEKVWGEMRNSSLPKRKAVLFLLSWRKISFQDRLLVCAGDGLPRRSASGILSEDDKVVAIKHNFAEFSYLGGRLKHFQVIGGTNASTLWNKNVQREITRTIFEPHNIGVL